MAPDDNKFAEFRDLFVLIYGGIEVCADVRRALKKAVLEMQYSAG